MTTKKKEDEPVVAPFRVEGSAPSSVNTMLNDMAKATKDMAMSNQKVKIEIDLTFDEALEIIQYLKKLRGEGV